MPAKPGPREAQLRGLRKRNHAARQTRVAPALITASLPSQSEPVINAVAPVINGAANASPAAKSNAQRQAEWRVAHPETARKRARDGMRKRRAAAKA